MDRFSSSQRMCAHSLSLNAAYVRYVEEENVSFLIYVSAMSNYVSVDDWEAYLQSEARMHPTAAGFVDEPRQHAVPLTRWQYAGPRWTGEAAEWRACCAPILINSSDGRANATITESNRLCAGVCMFVMAGVDEEMFIGGHLRIDGNVELRVWFNLRPFAACCCTLVPSFPVTLKLFLLN